MDMSVTFRNFSDANRGCIQSVSSSGATTCVFPLHLVLLHFI